MILYGAGGHANVIYNCLVSQKINVSGVFDDNPDKLFNGNSVMSPYNIDVLPDKKLIISIGSNKISLHTHKIHKASIWKCKTSYSIHL